jgi:hypothetical protein
MKLQILNIKIKNWLYKCHKTIIVEIQPIKKQIIFTIFSFD